MNRINLSDDVSLSQIIYGMWRLTEDSDTSPSYVNQKIEACLDQQITTIDQADIYGGYEACLLYTSPSPRDRQKSRMPSSA